LADVVTFLAFRADVIVVEIGAQVMETGLGIGQQVPDDDQDGATEGNDGSGPKTTGESQVMT
jgi:hypothetical protein